MNHKDAKAQRKTWIRLCVLVPLWFAAASSAAETKTLLFFGDSLTAGYGLEDPTTSAFPARVQKKVDDSGLPWRVVNAGLSGETSAGGRRRVDWILRNPARCHARQSAGDH
jgi:acyl-CoA thioesterase-1